MLILDAKKRGNRLLVLIFRAQKRKFLHVDQEKNSIFSAFSSVLGHPQGWFSSFGIVVALVVVHQKQRTFATD